jgi:ribosomal protein S18 acetylase RimI-like enzyme
VTVRWATVDDVDELVRLRRVMFESMGLEVPASVDDVVADALRAGLPSGDFFAAVVDGPDGSWLAACGVGMTSRRLPGPNNVTGTYGYVQSMATDPRARRQGHARAVMTLLLERFAELGVGRVELHATTDGEPLYRSLGFVEPHQVALDRRRPV